MSIPAIELKNITKVDLCVIDLEGITVATTFNNDGIQEELIMNFVKSPADSQIVGGYHMLKILEDGEVLYVLIAQGAGADAYTIGKVAVCQIQNLVIAYKEHFDKNNFFQTEDDYSKDAGVFDDEGNRLFVNSENNGRFHSDWCSMIYQRLLVSRSLLSDDGVIFISIDDNEVENLKKAFYQSCRKH